MEDNNFHWLDGDYAINYGAPESSASHSPRVKHMLTKHLRVVLSGMYFSWQIWALKRRNILDLSLLSTLETNLRTDFSASRSTTWRTK